MNEPEFVMILEEIAAGMDTVLETLADSIIQILEAAAAFDITQLDDNKIRIAAQFIVDTIRIIKIIFGG